MSNKDQVANAIAFGAGLVFMATGIIALAQGFGLVHPPHTPEVSSDMQILGGFTLMFLAGFVISISRGEPR